VQVRRNFKQVTTLDVRLEKEAVRLRAQADGLPPGAERERLLRRIREIERTCEWISCRL